MRKRCAHGKISAAAARTSVSGRAMKLPGRLPEGRDRDTHIQRGGRRTPTRRSFLAGAGRVPRLCWVSYSLRRSARPARRRPHLRSMCSSDDADNTVTMLSKHSRWAKVSPLGSHLAAEGSKPTGRRCGLPSLQRPQALQKSRTDRTC
jgi:hypothetical protein